MLLQIFAKKNIEGWLSHCKNHKVFLWLCHSIERLGHIKFSNENYCGHVNYYWEIMPTILRRITIVFTRKQKNLCTHQCIFICFLFAPWICFIYCKSMQWFDVSLFFSVSIYRSNDCSYHHHVGVAIEFMYVHDVFRFGVVVVGWFFFFILLHVLVKFLLEKSWSLIKITLN